jgi:branched-chain amino acid aminotransferase
MQYHVNGEVVPAEEATISVRDRGFMYGDAAFETMRAYAGRPFRWDAHADRLATTCDLLAIDHGLSDADLRGRIDETLAANDLREAYVKLSITRGVQPGKLTPDPVDEPGVVVLVSELPRGGTAGEAVWDAPVTTEFVDVERVPDAAIPARAKTHNYLNGILARLATDADTALTLDGDGYLAEAATSNCFFVRDGVLHTPSLDGPILPGITRRTVLELADEAGIPAETGRYRPDDLRTAAEVFLTNSTWELRPVARVDGEVPAAGTPGPITTALTAAYDRLVDREYYDRRHVD